MNLSEKEAALLNKSVIITGQLDYGGRVGVVGSGTEGIICDFGRSSGDPVVDIGSGTKVVVPWSYIRVKEGG